MRTPLDTSLLTRIVAAIRRAHQNQRASALTEFVIGLPIFILIFAGVSDIYQINNTALVVKAAASSKTFADAVSIQTTLRPAHMNPVGSAIVDLAQGNYNGFGDAFINGLSGAGIYADSGVKVGLADLILPVNPEPKVTLAPIMGQADESGSNLYSYNLLNDLVSFEKESFSTPSFTNITSGILSLTGARPAIAAGIRYGAARGEDSGSVKGNFGTYEMGASYSLPAPPMPTHRAISVALTRLEFARSKPFDSTIVVFDMSADTSGADEQIKEASNCAAGAQLYAKCIEDNPLCSSNEPGNACPCNKKDWDVSEECAGGGNPLEDLFGGWKPPKKP